MSEAKSAHSRLVKVAVSVMVAADRGSRGCKASSIRHILHTFRFLLLRAPRSGARFLSPGRTTDFDKRKRSVRVAERWYWDFTRYLQLKETIKARRAINILDLRHLYRLARRAGVNRSVRFRRADG